MMTGRYHIITRSGAIWGDHERSVVKNRVTALRVRNIDLVVFLICLRYNMMCSLAVTRTRFHAHDWFYEFCTQLFRTDAVLISLCWLAFVFDAVRPATEHFKAALNNDFFVFSLTAGAAKTL